MLTDPVSDYLTRLRNGLKAEHEEVVIPSSRLKKEMSRILKEQGYISDFEVATGEKGEVIKVTGAATSPRARCRGSRAAWAPQSSPPPPA
jgi:small subunit ribosomal protein S8